jgi:hypothetical protein
MQVPGTVIVAFSWELPRAVPYVIAAGVGQVMIGTAGFTVSCTAAVTVV